MNRKTRSMREARRILDANFNRSREGLRVCEDIARFVWESKSLAIGARRLRRRILSVFSMFDYPGLLSARNAEADVERHAAVDEKKRGGWTQMHRANIQRAKESLRVLEEVSKVVLPAASGKFKRLRFGAYEYEKRCSKKR